ncbi:MAG: hypothetical protein IH971_08125 [Candidatus Marinimicrobia bacterium]|nr:hypothetical protein [Candidatus Neomarinimicrobiota bacterium]
MTEQSIIALARADARRRHSGDAWGVGGGLLGAGAMFVGGIFGLITTYSDPGFLVGVAVGPLPVPLLFSLLPVSVPEPPQLEDAAPGQREVYRQTFIGESRRLRRTSAFKAELGALILVGGFFVLIFLV